MAAVLLVYFDTHIYDYHDCELIKILEENKDVECRMTSVLYEITDCYCSEAGGYVSCYDCVTFYQWETICDGSRNVNYNVVVPSGGSGSSTSTNDTRPDPEEDEFVLDPILNQNFPCGGIIFSNPFLGKVINQIKLDYGVRGNTPCLTDTDGNFGLNLWMDMSIDVETRMPSWMIDGVFGYQNQQTNLATIFSDAVKYATELVMEGFNCDNAVSKTNAFRNLFFNYINDPDVKKDIFGSSHYQIEFIRNHRSNIPNYKPEILTPNEDEASSNCND